MGPTLLPDEVVPVPRYLRETYWWAYVHPRSVRLFERQWLVNAILWGNFARLRDAALEALGETLPGRTLQVACVYGDFTQRLAQRLAPGATLEVVDVLPVQLDNLRRKLPSQAGLSLRLADAARLPFAAGRYARVVMFFLLHEVPADVRRLALAEAMRVLAPGGRLVLIDYHRPGRWHPLRLPMRWILRHLEPFALDLWAHELAEWLPAGARVVSSRASWGGLYQRVVVEAP